MSLMTPSSSHVHVRIDPVRVGYLLVLQKFRRKCHKRQQVQCCSKEFSVDPSSTMAAGASVRLVTETTTQAVPTPPDTQLPSSSSTSGSSDTETTSPYHIPSLKFPFLWEDEAKKPPQRTSRSAEQRAALITLGAAATASSSSSTPEKKKEGVFLSEAAKNLHLLLPLLAYEITRRMILRTIGAAQLALARQCCSKIMEGIIHKAIVNCQSFTLIGVAGFLVGSVPLFLEGCALVTKSFFMRFHAMSHKAVSNIEIIRLLLEALDMFLIGTALLTFGMGMYVMFYGSRSVQEQEQRHANRSHLGAFNLKTLKEGARMRCITQAKTRIGHAILLLLQVGVLEKFEGVPLVTGLDMACCGGAVLASSAGVFLLSKLHMGSSD